MHYVFYCEDKPDSMEKRRSVRLAHLKRLTDLKNQGRLLIAGPLLGGDDENVAISGIKGSMIVAEFSDLETAKAWIAADPYVTADIYANITVTPFKAAIL